MEPTGKEPQQLTMKPQRRMQDGDVQQLAGRPPEAFER